MNMMMLLMLLMLLMVMMSRIRVKHFEQTFVKLC
jgi:hypothetical protein